MHNNGGKQSLSFNAESCNGKWALSVTHSLGNDCWRHSLKIESNKSYGTYLSFCKTFFSVLLRRKNHLETCQSCAPVHACIHHPSRSYSSHASRSIKCILECCFSHNWTSILLTTETHIDLYASNPSKLIRTEKAFLIRPYSHPKARLTGYPVYYSLPPSLFNGSHMADSSLRLSSRM